MSKSRFIIYPNGNALSTAFLGTFLGTFPKFARNKCAQALKKRVYESKYLSKENEERNG